MDLLVPVGFHLDICLHNLLCVQNLQHEYFLVCVLLIHP